MTRAPQGSMCLPEDRARHAVRADPVINAVPDLASQVAGELRNREFKINKVEDSPQKFDHIAKLSFGPKALAASVVVRAFFLDETDDGGFDIKRTDDAVDVIVGS